jgi:hypothetical protein
VEKLGRPAAPACPPAPSHPHHDQLRSEPQSPRPIHGSRLKLRDIKDLLAIRDTGECPCEPAAELLRRRLTDLDAELARLTALRQQMVGMLEALPSQNCPPPSPGRWCTPEDERR